MKQFDTIVVGGGAAGLMAAGQSAMIGKRVLLIEKMNKPGRKLGITGKGRCNITNIAEEIDFINRIKPNGRFLRSAFSNFFSYELIEFFNDIGVQTVTERGGRVFPENGKATEVVRSMINWCNKKGVKMLTNFKVEQLIKDNGRVIGIRGKQNNNNNTEIVSYFADKIIIATGGLSYPSTGSTGDGYELAKSVGHKINPLWPSLVPIETEGTKAQKLSGLELRNIKGTLWINGKKAGEDFGEMSFTDFGITGPIVLSLSRLIVPAIKKKQDVNFSLDLKPALDDKKLDNRLLRDFDQKGNETFRNILTGLLPKALISSCIQYTKIDGNKLGHQITALERKELRKWLKSFEFKVNGHRPFEEAIITAGGIDTNEINQKTMESKLIKGLFFAGEIIDLDAPTGGYNLQIAFSTAYAAAHAPI